jgi:hypothetical protein
MFTRNSFGHKTIATASPALVRTRRSKPIIVFALCFLLSPLLCIFGSAQEPRIGYERRIETGLQELRRFGYEDRQEVVRRFQLGAGTSLLPEHRQAWLSAFEKEGWLAEKHQLRANDHLWGGRTVFLDVKRDKDRVSIVRREAADLWFQEMGFGGAETQSHTLDSRDQIGPLIDGAGTVIHRGDSLPDMWQLHLRTQPFYVRSSSSSPKTTPAEFLRASEILDRRPRPGTLRIMSALPQSTGWVDFPVELHRMGLSVFEASGWSKLRDQMTQLQTELRETESKPSSDGEPLIKPLLRHHRIESASKAAFLNELAHGGRDQLMLIAHFEDGELHFPDGDTLSLDELRSVKRETAPDRTLILISCKTGEVNEPVQSLAEIALQNKLALNVIAPPQPVSATDVPNLLRNYLVEQQSIKDVFLTNGNFHNITENLRPAPGTNADRSSRVTG